jgi:hypothetical protein
MAAAEYYWAKEVGDMKLYWRVSELARSAGVSNGVVYYWIKMGWLGCVSVPARAGTDGAYKKYRIPQEEADRALRLHRAGLSPAFSEVASVEV